MRLQAVPVQADRRRHDIAWRGGSDRGEQRHGRRSYEFGIPWTGSDHGRVYDDNHPCSFEDHLQEGPGPSGGEGEGSIQLL